ncbi:MAG: UTP--glucose-1-phosphate uridylyltransferase AglF [Methanosaeta sp. PtaU1.Bin112]|nr:MAG: UTP--glucose-1-phosphate uridylyltransferase AglF [Methanosaeta sp. PtaU1.Bin112]
MNLMVKKAVIPAAGLGTRFLPLTKAQPKEMLPVVDKPVIQYVVEEAVASGIEDILIITGRSKRAIEDHFDVCFELEWKLKQKGDSALYEQTESLSNMVDIHYIRQKEQKGLGDAILHAERHCDGEPFAVLLGDTITIPVKYEKTCTSQMIDAFSKFQSSIIAVEPVAREKIKDYGIIDGKKLEGGAYRIQDIVEKPKPENAPSNLGAIGRYVLTPDIFGLLKDTPPGHGNEVQLTDALRRLNGPIGLVTKCRRYDIGDKLGWMKSNIELSLEREEFSGDLKAFLKILAANESGSA